MNAEMGKWSKIVVKLIDLVECLNDYSSPDELVLDLDNAFSEAEKSLLLKHLNGYVDHKKVIDLLIDTYYLRDGRNCLRKERSLYLVISYLIIFGDDNSIDILNSIASSINDLKFVKFLRYFLNEKNLLTYIKHAWLTLYNVEYVEKNLIEPLLKKIKYFENFLNEEKQFQLASSSSRNVTVPQPFNFTGNVVRKILLPEPLLQKEFEPKMSKSLTKRRFISANNAKSLDLGHVKKKKEKKKKIVIDRKSDKDEPSLVRHIDHFKANPFVFKENSIPVKLNTAAILKEENLVEAQIRAFCDQYGYNEKEIKNAAKYWSWRRCVRLEELRNQTDKLRSQRDTCQKSFESAIIARQNLVGEKQKQARLYRHDLEHACRQDEAARAELAETRRLRAAQSSQEIRDKYRLTKQTLLDSRRLNAGYIADMSRQLENKALKIALNEMKERVDLIQSIKSQESAMFSIGRQKFVDLGEAPAHGLLTEMSILELKERLELTRQESEQSKKEKHERLVREKRQSGERLLEKLQFINSARQHLINLSHDDLTDGIKEETVKNAINLHQNQEEQPKQQQHSQWSSKNLNPIEIDEARRRHQQYITYSKLRDLLEKKRLADIEQRYEKTSNILYQ